MSGLFDTLPANSSCTPVVIPSPTAPPVGAALDNLAANGGLRRLRRRLQAPPPPPQTAFKYTECDLYEDLRNETFIEFASRVQEIGVARVVPTPINSRKYTTTRYRNYAPTTLLGVGTRR